MAKAKFDILTKCPICGTVFQMRTIDAVYCCKKCSDTAYKRKKDQEEKEKHYSKIAKEIPDVKGYFLIFTTV